MNAICKRVGAIRLYYAPSGKRKERFLLGVGQYENGRAALWLAPLDGEPTVGPMTVNLVEKPLAEVGLHVRTDRLREALELRQLGILESVSEDPIPAGHVDDYARLWRWAPCRGHVGAGNRSGEAYAGRTAGGHLGLASLAIFCPECLARIQQTYEKTEERHLARDTIKRLGEGSSS